MLFWSLCPQPWGNFSGCALASQPPQLFCFPVCTVPSVPYLLWCGFHFFSLYGFVIILLSYHFNGNLKRSSANRSVTMSIHNPKILLLKVNSWKILKSTSEIIYKSISFPFYLFIYFLIYLVVLETEPRPWARQASALPLSFIPNLFAFFLVAIWHVMHQDLEPTVANLLSNCYFNIKVNWVFSHMKQYEFISSSDLLFCFYFSESLNLLFPFYWDKAMGLWLWAYRLCVTFIKRWCSLYNKWVCISVFPLSCKWMLFTIEGD